MIINTDELIDEANSKAEVQEAVAAFVTALNNIPTDAQLSAQELADAKASAKDTLDAIDLSKYRPEERAQVEELIRNGKVAIDQCESVEEVEELLNKIMTVINSIKTEAELSQAALIQKQTQQRTNIVIIVISALTLLIGMGLAFFFIRRRRLH